MIKINLLASSRPVAKKKLPIQLGNKLTVGCGLILVLAGSGIAWRFMTLRQQSLQLDQDITAAQEETRRLHAIIQQVQQFEQRKAQLQQRVALIEQLRKEQTGPVHMLDQISRALPPLLWLNDLKQGADPNEVTITGRCTTLTGLSDFVANLEASGYFKKSVEIVSTQVQAGQKGGESLILFTIKAIFQRPGAEPAPAPATRRGGRARS